MSDPLKILAPTRYPWLFNGPRFSRHAISVRSFLPLNKISSKIEGVTLFNPFPLQHFDLIHAFNRIPLGVAPFIIGFESHLPRAFGLQKSKFFHAMTDVLASERCKVIIAISDYARRQFLRQHADSSARDALATKLVVRYPNFPLSGKSDDFNLRADAPVRLVFVGNHFGRKGGSVAVRLAQKALRQGLKLQVDIVSGLEIGRASWVGPTRIDYWANDVRMLRTLPNVRHYAHMSNREVIDLVKKAHFSLLPTLSDSFGYSAIEAMAYGTPLIATRQCALPEFIQDGVNGILLDLEVNRMGEWRHVWNPNRQSEEYEALFESEMTRLTDEAYAKISDMIKTPSRYLSLRAAARETAQKMFSAIDATQYWDELYLDVLRR